jgi:hypothetical protein
VRQPSAFMRSGSRFQLPDSLTLHSCCISTRTGIAVDVMILAGVATLSDGKAAR